MAQSSSKDASRLRDISEEVVEKGDIYFAYRPRVEQQGAEGLSDIQRFYMVMKPEGQARFRVAVLGRKRLPEAGDHERSCRHRAFHRIPPPLQSV